MKKICPPIEDITIYEQMKQHPHENMANIIDYEQKDGAFIKKQAEDSNFNGDK